MNITRIDTTNQIEVIHSHYPKFDSKGNEKQSLAGVYQYQDKTMIFDNHNHALYYWAGYLLQTNQTLPVIHIDQHSDLATPDSRNNLLTPHSLEDREHIAYTVCNIGNFIVPALESGLIRSCEQIRTETTLLEYTIPKNPYILDIDLDFWAPEMINDYTHQTLEKTRNLITNASFITIATSPGYIAQELALETLKKLLCTGD